MAIKYTLSQYVHDGFRLKLLDTEKRELLGYAGAYEFVRARLKEIVDDELTINERMAKFERHPNNR